MRFPFRTQEAMRRSGAVPSYLAPLRIFLSSEHETWRLAMLQRFPICQREEKIRLAVDLALIRG